MAGCGLVPFGPGWRGSDVHLVDDTWVATERPCRDDDADCRLVLDLALGALAPEFRRDVTAAVLADLPRTYVTATGESRLAPMMRGLDMRQALIVDLVGGERRAVGLWCYLPHHDARLDHDAATCTTGDLSYWRDGSSPPGGLQ
jgi:hypothetical protein